ncbi:hypothetical protein STEG23_036408 [Scotinomys teguina]
MLSNLSVPIKLKTTQMVTKLQVINTLNEEPSDPSLSLCVTSDGLSDTCTCPLFLTNYPTCQAPSTGAFSVSV